MDGNTAIDFRNPAMLRKAGMSALQRELGTVGATYFIRQFTAGQGDYTAERDEQLEGITLDEAIKGIRELDERRE